MGAALLYLQTAWLNQRGHLFSWVPVAIAIGVGLYFSLKVEPPLWVLALVGATAFGAWALRGSFGAYLQPVVLAGACVAIGFSLAGARANLVSGPVLTKRYYGPVQGRIVAIDRSASDKLRLTLDQVVLRRTDPANTPKRVRVSLHGSQGFVEPEPGRIVILTGHLSPLRGAVEPGGFDFRRHAWFQRLGAVGYTRSPVLTWQPPGRGQMVFQLRLAMADRVRAAIDGQTGAVAAAIITGDRSSLSKETITVLRRSNLAHLLAISGLHMGLLAGTVFLAVRLILVLSVRQTWPVKKIAAFVALIMACGYLALSGGNVATQRAFVMVAVALTAILADRRAVSFRALAIAAIIMLVLRPEALLGPGFQMSFAATTALVCVFGALRGTGQHRWPKPLVFCFGVFLSSAVAGAATGPIGMAHFNQVSKFGLLANLASVPLMGALIMPAALLAVVAMPFGLEFLPLQVVGWGFEWILFVAHEVSGWDGATGFVVRPDAIVLPLLAMGALFVMLWQGALRWAGAVPVVVAISLWNATQRPDFLIADDGGLVGVLTAQGRALSREKGSGFVARVWLENDGDDVDQMFAARRWTGRSPRLAVWDGPKLSLVHVVGKKSAAEFTGCRKDQIVIANTSLPRIGKCDIRTPADLSQTGALAIFTDGATLRIVSEAQIAGTRLWTP